MSKDSDDASTSIEIRKYKPEDREAALELFLTGMLDGFDPIKQPESLRQDTKWTEKVAHVYDDISSFVHIQNGGCLFCAVDRNDTVIGTIGLQVSDEDKKMRRAALVRMYVTSKRRGQGIGNLLLKFIIDYARVHLKLKSIWLETVTNLRAACWLYTKFGFKEKKRKKEGNRQIGTVDFRWSLVMEKELHESHQ